MRLIDADAIVTVQSFDIEHEEYNKTEMKHSGKTVSTYTGCPDSVAIAEHIRRWHYSEERKAEVLKKLKK